MRNKLKGFTLIELMITVVIIGILAAVVEFVRLLQRTGRRGECRPFQSHPSHRSGLGPHDGALLEADHILPRSLKGPTDIDNLQTLCERCNQGKSNRDTRDLRPNSQ